MEASEFKNGIKELKSYLKGVTLSIQTKYSICPYKTLNAFGHEVLNQESIGKSFSIQSVWTSEGIKSVSTFQDLLNLFKSSTVTGIRFNAYVEEVYDECSFIRSWGRLD